MAIPKGNFMALQPLKPVEYKVGDLYANLMSDMIKRGDAQKAAQAKALQDQKKMIGDRFDKININPYATISNLTDMAGRMYKETADFIAEQRMKADADPANAYMYLSLADRAKTDYMSLSTALGSEDFIKKSNDKAAAIANNEAFTQSDDLEQYNLISKGMLNAQFDKANGVWKFAVPQNKNAQDSDNANMLSTGQIVDVFTKPSEKNLLPEFDKNVQNIAKTMADEWSKNTDGLKQVEWKGFAEDRANKLFDSTYGTSYNANYVNPELKQAAKARLGINITDDESFGKVKKLVVDQIASYVPTATKVDVKDSDLEIAIKKQQLENARLEAIQKRQDIANPNRGRKGSNGDNDGGAVNGASFYSAGNQDAFVLAKDASGSVKGVQQIPMRILSLPKLKGQPATNNVFGVTSYKNNAGKVVNAYYLGAPANDGKIVTSRISENELNTYFTKIGYNPTVAKSYLFSQSSQSDNPNIPYLGQGVKPKMIKDTPYQNLDIVFKTKYDENQER